MSPKDSSGSVAGVDSGSALDGLTGSRFLVSDMLDWELLLAIYGVFVL